MANRKITNVTNTPKLKTKLSPAELKRIIALEEAYTAHVLANPMIWLPDQDIINLDQDQAPNFGFAGLVRPQDLDFDISDMDVFDLENITKRARGKSKGSKPRKPSGPQNLPSAQVAKQVVDTYFKNVKPAGLEGNVILGEQNALFGSKQKAITYQDSWEVIVKAHHVIFWSEISDEFLKEISAHNGLEYAVSKANTRDQAVGITWSDRFELVAGPFSYDKVASVQGIPDLRPALVVVLRDKTTGAIYKFMANHLKSMRGGPAATAPVRFQQCVEIVKAHGKASPKGIKPRLKNMQVRSIWKNQVFGRGFLDHSTLTVTMLVCKLPAEELARPLKDRIEEAPTVMAGDWNTAVGQTNDLDPLEQAGYMIFNRPDNTATHSMGTRLDAFLSEKPNNPTCAADVPDAPVEVDSGE
ncbi:MAG: hypothetical protein SGJ27_10505 [Candidatus Melainabacteria bacterium]|nr:hypothetical protein [Candidatus Melainabacteria bacterium]